MQCKEKKKETEKKAGYAYILIKQSSYMEEFLVIKMKRNLIVTGRSLV